MQQPWRSIVTTLVDNDKRLAMGQRGRQRVAEEFTFAAQSDAYVRLFHKLTQRGQDWPDISASSSRPAAPVRRAW